MFPRSREHQGNTPSRSLAGDLLQNPQDAGKSLAQSFLHYMNYSDSSKALKIPLTVFRF